MNKHIADIKFAFKATVPILLGYLAIGVAFGLITLNAGYPWYIVLLASMFVYAGAGQYAMIPMCAMGSSFADIALAVFLINFRHMVYGLSLLEKFSNMGIIKPYLIFGLTDETYGLLVTTKIPKELNRRATTGFIVLFDHCYWISGGLIGYFAGSLIPFDFAGVDFALTSLFIVLLMEQWKNCDRKLVFAIAGGCCIIAILIASFGNMLLVSFILVLIALIVFRRRIEV